MNGDYSPPIDSTTNGAHLRPFSREPPDFGELSRVASASETSETRRGDLGAGGKNAIQPAIRDSTELAEVNPQSGRSLILATNRA